MLGIYFSGTGNTEYCIKKFLGYFDGNPSVVSIENKDVLSLLHEHREFVLAYPIYFSNLPKILRDFLLQHGEAFRGKKIFIIATMGLFSGDGAGCAARLLKKSGAEVTGGLHIQMPDCIADEKLLKRPLEKNREIVKRAGGKLKKAAMMYLKGTPPKEGLSVFSHMAGLLGQRLWFYQKTQQYSGKLKIETGKCIGCSRCVSLCPMENLYIAKGKAAAKGKCTMCYRCIVNCPRQAITLLGKEVIYQGHIEEYLK